MTKTLTRPDRFREARMRRQKAIERWQAHENVQVAIRIRMHVSPWFRDEFRNPSRVVRCAE